MQTKSVFSRHDAKVILFAHLGLESPATMQDLKSGYRRMAKELHPDLNPHGTELFKKLQEAYEWLTSPEIIGIICSGEIEAVQCTVDGTPLSELGLGFDNTKNGTDCSECQHLGYRKVVEEKIHLCRECCGAAYTYANSCSACSGTGKFTQKNSKRVVDCLRCSGTGTIHYKHLSRCTACVRGYITNKSNKVTYHLCSRCLGIGELEIFNPVLRKGLLATSSR